MLIVTGEGPWVSLVYFGPWVPVTPVQIRAVPLLRREQRRERRGRESDLKQGAERSEAIGVQIRAVPLLRREQRRERRGRESDLNPISRA